MRFVILTTSPIIDRTDGSNYVNKIESTYTFNSGNAEYAYISYSATVTNPILSEGDTAVAGTGYNLDWLSLSLDNIPSVLSGKKIINFGDSIAENRTGSKSYAVQICEKVGADLSLNYAVGGATISNVSGQTMSSILSQIQTGVSSHPSPTYSYDIALFDGACNDYDKNRAIGTVVKTNGAYTPSDYTATFDTTTFAGAMEECIRTLRNAYVNLIIIYVIPHKHGRYDSRWDTLLNTAREVCEKWSIGIVDMDKDGELNTRISSMITDYTDAGGTHPNTLGIATFYVPKIMEKLCEYFA